MPELDRSGRRAAQDVSIPWLAGRALPLAREAVLPPGLLIDIDARRLFAGRPATLAVLAPRLARLSGLAVRVMPDAELPASLFLPRLAGAQPPAKPAASAAPRAYSAGGTQPLSQLLDSLAAQWGVYWRHRGGAIEFYRTQTRIFPLARPSLAAHTDILYESANSQGIPQSTVKTHLADMGPHSLDELRVRVESLLTRAGVATVQPGAEPAVVVTDTPPALARVAAFLADSNRSATRRVRLVFEEIHWAATAANTPTAAQASTQTGTQTGTQASTSASTSASISAAAQTCAAGVDWDALHRAAAGDAGHAGAEAVLAELRRTGTILSRRSIPVVTLNHRPVTHALRAVFPTAWPGQPERTSAGSLLTVLPDIQPDGSILVSVAYDSTAARAYADMAGGSASGAQAGASGAGAALAIEGGGTVQQLALRPSQALIIAGYDDTGYGNPGYGTAGYGTAGYGTAGYGTAGYGTAGYGTAAAPACGLQKRRGKLSAALAGTGSLLLLTAQIEGEAVAPHRLSGASRDYPL